MMSRANPLQSYMQVATETASPARLVLMLYDGAIRFLENAQRGFEAEDPLEFNQTIHNNVMRAIAILDELNASLDLERGGECAANFRRLYDYMAERLYESNRLKNPEGVEETIRRLTTLRDAWSEMLQKELPALGHAA